MGQKFQFAAIILAIIVIATLVSVLVFFFEKNPSGESPAQVTSCASLAKVSSAEGNVSSKPGEPNATFLVVEADSGSPFYGMNGSAYHVTEAWPVIHVYQNQTITIRIFNCASSEPHGFAVSNYFNGGVTLPSGQSYTFTFVADQKGTFRMYCNTFCSIHAYMQNGQLVVA